MELWATGGSGAAPTESVLDDPLLSPRTEPKAEPLAPMVPFEEEEIWTTRCICGDSHKSNEPCMLSGITCNECAVICCEKCNNWLHCGDRLACPLRPGTPPRVLTLARTPGSLHGPNDDGVHPGEVHLPVLHWGVAAKGHQEGAQEA